MAINATAVWRVRPSGSNNNGGGYDAGIGGAATDYSQQNAAQATGTNATCTTGTSTFVDATANAFTSAMVGNCIQIRSGTNFTAGFYFVTGFTSASTVTLDRSPVGASNGSAGVWSLGGGWANFWTNISTVVSNNTVYILGTGTPNPAAYTYDYDCTTQCSVPNVYDVFFFNDPLTPGFKAYPDLTGGMPVIKFDLANHIFADNGAGGWKLQGLWFVGTTTAAGKYVSHTGTNQSRYSIWGCVLDQFGFDVGMGDHNTQNAQYTFANHIACEVFSSVVPGAAGSAYAFTSDASTGTGFVVNSCNIHDCVGHGIFLGTHPQMAIINNIIAKCQGNGIAMTSNAGSFILIQNNTIDGNLGWGLTLQLATNAIICNNIISNHTTAAKGGFQLAGGTLWPFGFDYNVYYNNTTDISGGSYGPHDTHGGSNPFVGQPTENYALA